MGHVSSDEVCMSLRLPKCFYSVEPHLYLYALLQFLRCKDTHRILADELSITIILAAELKVQKQVTTYATVFH